MKLAATIIAVEFVTKDLIHGEGDDEWTQPAGTYLIVKLDDDHVLPKAAPVFRKIAVEFLPKEE